MARTASTMAPLGAAAPTFALPDTKGGIVRLEDFADAPALVVMFVSNHCPFVLHIHDALVEFSHEAMDKGAAVVAIASNDIGTHPQDGPDAMRERADAHGYRFPYLYDESQEVAKAYTAACTPDFFLFDRDRKLVYRGQFDGSRPGNDEAITGEDLRDALERVLAGEPVAVEQRPSIGCNIKWRAGNEPGYYGGAS